MEIKVLCKEYLNSDNLYQDFLEDKILENGSYDDPVDIQELKYFPIYLAINNEKKLNECFMEAFEVMESVYLQNDREVLMHQSFWHSLLLIEFRGKIISQYPEVLKSRSKFNNIILKKFDWENYIYKVLLGAQHISDNISDHQAKKRYYKLIIQNLDIYNYIIKYEIFRNEMFLINVLDIIDRKNLSSVLKKKIKGREDLGDDERYGRRVIYEFNKSYPVLMSPMLSYEETEEYFLKFLFYYYKEEL